MDKRANGIALMEVLVTLIIIAVGLLGVVKMQLLAKRYTLDAVQRTHASLYADDIIERMRANRQTDLKAYGLLGTKVGRQTLSQPDVPACTIKDPCSATDRVERDLWEWQQLMDGIAERYPSENYGLKQRAGSGGLIFPTGCLAVTDAANGNGYDVIVTITWQGLFEAGDAQSASGIANCGANPLNTNYYHRQLTVRTFIERAS